jgi:hypothetical protein
VAKIIVMQNEKNKSVEETKRDLEASRIRFERLSREKGVSVANVQELRSYGANQSGEILNISWPEQRFFGSLNQDSLNIAVFGE